MLDHRGVLRDDQQQARPRLQRDPFLWHAWHRHVTAALAFLAKLAADLRRAAWTKPNKTSPSPPLVARPHCSTRYPPCRKSDTSMVRLLLRPHLGAALIMAESLSR